MAKTKFLHTARELQSSLCACISVLFCHGMLTYEQRERLIDGIRNGDKAAYRETTRRLNALAKRAYREGRKNAKQKH